MSEEEMRQFWQLPEAGYLTISHTRVPEIKFFKATETESEKGSPHKIQALLEV